MWQAARRWVVKMAVITIAVMWKNTQRFDCHPCMGRRVLWRKVWVCVCACVCVCVFVKLVYIHTRCYPNVCGSTMSSLSKSLCVFLIGKTATSTMCVAVCCSRDVREDYTLLTWGSNHVSTMSSLSKSLCVFLLAKETSQFEPTAQAT